MTLSFLDTNVLVYLYDDAEPEKKARAMELFEEETGTGRAILNTQVLQEFYVNVTRKLNNPLSSERAGERVRDLCQLRLVQVDAPIILSAIARSQSQSFSFWDALILESAISAGADRLLTEDLQHGQVVGQLRVENPFL